MKALLDTHSFLWFIQDHPSLSPSARSFIESWENELFLSAASVWEMAIKISLGKLSVPSPFEGFIDEQCSINRFTWLPLRSSHLGLLINLPFHHRDPFDRLLIAQSIREQLAIISKDQAFDSYPVLRLW